MWGHPEFTLPPERPDCHSVGEDLADISCCQRVGNGTLPCGAGTEPPKSSDADPKAKCPAEETVFWEQCVGTHEHCHDNPLVSCRRRYRPENGSSSSTPSQRGDGLHAQHETSVRKEKQEPEHSREQVLTSSGRKAHG